MGHGQENGGAFPPTEWELVAKAGGKSDPSRVALSELLRRYWPALRAHLVDYKRVPLDRAEDLLQGFVADKILQRGLLALADRRRGRFRTFLLTALDRYVVSQYRRDTAEKRGAPVGLGDAGQLAVADATDPASSRAWDEAWARQVIAEAISRMKSECEAAGRHDLWGIFEDRVVKPALEDRAPAPYGEVLDRYGFLSPSQAANALITARRRFVRILRSVVAEYVDGDEEVEAEIAELRQSLSGRDDRPSA